MKRLDPDSNLNRFGWWLNGVGGDTLLGLVVCIVIVLVALASIFLAGVAYEICNEISDELSMIFDRGRGLIR